MKEPLTTQLPPSHCPSCGKPLDRATSVEGQSAPRPGDLTICVHCTAYLAFADDMSLRMLTIDEALELPDDVLQMLGRARTVFGRLKTAGAQIND